MRLKARLFCSYELDCPKLFRMEFVSINLYSGKQLFLLKVYKLKYGEEKTV